MRRPTSIWLSDFTDGLQIVMEYIPNLDIEGLAIGILATLCTVIFYSTNYGKETDKFVDYHLNRTCCVVLLTKSLPVIYFRLITDYLIDDEVAMLISTSVPVQYMKVVKLFFNLLTMRTFLDVLYWKCDIKSHPLVKNLMEFVVNENDDWQSIASRINQECRGRNTIKLPRQCFTRYVVTPNWFIKINPFTVNVLYVPEVQIAQVSYDDDDDDDDDVEFSTMLIVADRRHKVNEFLLTLPTPLFRRVCTLIRRQ